MNRVGPTKRLSLNEFPLNFLTMKNPKKRITLDPAMAQYDNVSLFPRKVALAKEMLAKTNLAKLKELLAKPL